MIDDDEILLLSNDIHDLQTAVYLILRHLTTEEQLTTKEIIEIKKLIRVA